MKIAMICTEKLPVPPIAGGAVQIYIEGILPYLSWLNDITVYGIQYEGLASEETKYDVRYIRLPAKTASEYVKNLRAALQAEDYDLIHVFNRPLWILSLSEALTDAKFSLSLHNEMFHPEKISNHDAVKCIERVEFINTVSKFIADSVIKSYPMAAPKLNVVYSAADISLYSPPWTERGILNKRLLKERYGLKGYKTVLFVGRLSVKKGVHILMKAMKRVMLDHPKTALVIVGSKWYGGNKTDDYTRSLHTLSKELAGPVIFTGFVPPSQIPALYNLGDIFVCPSQWDEPLARVHYEAMASGLPVITTNRGGNSEVVRGYGNGRVINDYNNPDAFASCINYLLDNPQKRTEMGHKGRKCVEERFNWERVSKEVLKTNIPRKTIT
ncbi:spore coat protein SA [Anaerobacterium chartisolvens]|uniref:Spore coat protein SA n=1 Tax=Anaerobacterium chartisolvens TaxID=1297424 RepID=A0A369AWA0_9FIRM|nr:glycosyltransferase family 4 protein [Anaerobacterium chartisolvens]RCX12526.1 spore coat protein SA [Anaerobacterium chartisolvens]